MRIRFVLCLVAPIALGACTDFAGVNTASTEMISAAQSWDGVVRELGEGCLRESQFKDNLDCTVGEQRAKGLQRSNSVLIAYFKALRDVSATGSYDISPGIAGLASGVAGIPGVNTGRVEAVADLAAVLARWALNGARERTLRGLIAEGGLAAEDIIGELAEDIPFGIEANLTTERIATHAEFERWLGGSTARRLIGTDPMKGCTKPPNGRVAGSGNNFLLALEYCRRQDIIGQRQAAIDDYRRSLAVAADILFKLRDGQYRLSSKALLLELMTAAKELEEKVGAVEDAFGEGAES